MNRSQARYERCKVGIKGKKSKEFRPRERQTQILKRTGLKKTNPKVYILL